MNRRAGAGPMRAHKVARYSDVEIGVGFHRRKLDTGMSSYDSAPTYCVRIWTVKRLPSIIPPISDVARSHATCPPSRVVETAGGSPAHAGPGDRAGHGLGDLGRHRVGKTTLWNRVVPPCACCRAAGCVRSAELALLACGSW